jgi:hypothetical protein
MGVPTSKVGYTSATTRRETTKSMRDMWWHWREREEGGERREGRERESYYMKFQLRLLLF